MSSEAPPCLSLSELPFPFSFLSYTLFVYLSLCVGYVCVWGGTRATAHVEGGADLAGIECSLSPSITQVIKLDNRNLHFTP